MSSASAIDRRPDSASPSVLLAVLEFHLRTGIRVALGLGSLGIVGFILVLNLHPEPMVFLRDAARGVAGGGGRSPAPFLLALAGAATALGAARRAALGTRGWELHLPISPVDQRRAFVLALVCAQILVFVPWVALWVGGLVLGASARVSSLVAVVWVMAASGTAASPFAGRWPRLLAWAALGSSAIGTWPSLLGATAALAVIERWGGGLRVGRKDRKRFSREWTSGLTAPVLAWSALGWRVLPLVLASLLPLGLAALVLRNNSDLGPGGIAVVVRGGGALGGVWAIMGLGGRLVLRRPPWAWNRSLPWSARTRVIYDAAFLALHAVPVLAGTLFLDAGAAGPLIGASVYLAVRAAGALRRSADSVTGLGWRLAVESTLLVLAVAAWPWTGAVLAALTPLALLAAERDEKGLKVSLLRERQYSAVGDPTC